MGTDESELVPAVNDKYGHAALHRLPVSRGYNRDVGLGGLPLLWCKMELANKLWEGYTGNGNASEKTHSFQCHPCSSEMCLKSMHESPC